MNRRDRVSVWVAASVAAVGVIGGVASGAYGLQPSDALDEPTVTPTITTPASVTFNQDGTIDTTNWGVQIPRCAEDDWNSTGLPRCYTERTTDGAVLVIDSTDTVIATITG